MQGACEGRLLLAGTPVRLEGSRVVRKLFFGVIGSLREIFPGLDNDSGIPRPQP
jgi:hypothetical protein